MGHIQRASVKHYAHLISEPISLIPCHCHTSGRLRTLVKFNNVKNKGEKNANNSHIGLA